MGFQIVDNKVINISENSTGNDNIIYHTAPIVFEAYFFPCKITYHSAVQDPKTESCAKINQNPPSAVSCIFVLWIAIIFCIYFIVFRDFKKLIIVVNSLRVSACGYSSAGHLSSFRPNASRTSNSFYLFSRTCSSGSLPTPSIWQLLNSVNNSPEASGAMTSNTAEIDCSTFRK